MELLKWMGALSMDCQVSVKGFCQAIKTRFTKHHKGFSAFEIKNIYQILIKETLAEYRFFLNQTQHLGSLHPDFDSGTQCAACYQVTKKVVSLDGDFQLDCSDFQAGNSVRSKNKSSKLSETAVFGSACRHDFPHMFFSLKHGERIGYSVFLIRKLLQNLGDGEKLNVMYDIACVLKAHLQKHPEHQDLLDKISLSIPIFHCYGHKASCQVLYSPRRMEGFGLSDGEGMERIWSFLGKFSSITKEMTPENRVDLLSEAILHFSENVDTNFSCTSADVEGWAATLKQNAMKKTVEVSFTKAENYSVILEKLIKVERGFALPSVQEYKCQSKI